MIIESEQLPIPLMLEKSLGCSRKAEPAIVVSIQRVS